jgi:hypothetical protein
MCEHAIQTRWKRSDIFFFDFSFLELQNIENISFHQRANEGGVQTWFKIRCGYVADDDDDVHVVQFLDGESLRRVLC